LFGIGLRGACPVATLSSIYIDLTGNETMHTFKLSPEPDVTTMSFRGGQENKYAIYDVRSKTADSALSIATVHKAQKSVGLNFPSILYANRYIIGKCT
jgi:phosphatidylinositol glycan class T